MFRIIDFLQTHIFFPKGDDIYNYCSGTQLDYVKRFDDLASDYKYVIYYEHKPSADSSLYKRVETKVTLGKYLNKFFGKLTPAQITHICEKVKSIVCDTGKFDIIEGSAISNAYYYRNYVPGHGTLNNSCMRYLNCQKKNFFDIYEDHAKMLIMTPKRGKRILGRAILWPYGDSYLMDRVYTTEIYLEHKFYAYAKEMGWGCLERNAYVNTRCVQKWLLPEDNYSEPHEVELRISLDKVYDAVPYVDSVCYMNFAQDTLSTIPFEGTSLMLHNTEGRKFIIY